MDTPAKANLLGGAKNMMEALRKVDSRNEEDWKDKASRERRPPGERHDGLVGETLWDVERLVPEWEEEFLRGSEHSVWLNSVWGRTAAACVQTPPRPRPMAVLKVVLKKRSKRSGVPDGSRPA